MTSKRFDYPRLLAISAGAAVPLLVFGRVALAATLALVAVCGLMLEDRSEHWRRLLQGVRTPMGMMIMVTFVLWLPNLVVSVDPLRSFEGAARTLVIIGLMTIIWSVLSRDRRLLDVALKALILASSIATAIAVLSLTVAPEIYWITHLKGWRSDPSSLPGAMHGLKSFTGLFVLLIPVLLWSAWGFSARWRVIAILICLGFCFNIWLTFNRSAMAGAIGALVAVCLVIAWGHGRKFATWLVVATGSVLVVGLFAYLDYRRGMNPACHAGVENLLPAWLVGCIRQEMWMFSLELMREFPWFGLGINTINFQPGADQLMPGSGGLNFISGHPHNWAIEVLAETGIIGFTSLVILIVVMFAGLVRGYVRDHNPAILAAIAVAAGYWCSGLFNFSFWSMWWQASFMLLIVFCMAANEPAASAN